MKRGDLVTVALQGDFGKPRPALVIHADRFDETATVTILPITGALAEAPPTEVAGGPLRDQWLAETVSDHDRQGQHNPAGQDRLHIRSSG